MKSFYFFILLVFLFLESANSDPTFNALFIDKTADQITTTIPSPFEENIKSICEGFEASSNQKWESVIEEGNVTILFQCLDANNSQSDSQWKIKLLSNYIKSFERNRPQKWDPEEQQNNFTCKDSYGREIPMPLGVQRCFIQHHSIVDPENTKKFIQTQESGTFAKPILNEISEYSCADSFSWKPFSSPPSTPSTSKILNDQECAVKVSLTSMHFFCCCYTNGDICGEVGKIASKGLTCPQLSMNSTVTVDEVGKKYAETENVEERISALDLILQKQCHMRISIRRPKRDPIIQTSLSLVKNDDDICCFMFAKTDFSTQESCVHFERQCYTDVDDELIYCCKFDDSDESDGTEDDKILAIHSIYGKFLFEEIEYHFGDFKNCLRPFSYKGNTTSYCIYFYDKILDKFVNIQRGENFRTSGGITQAIDNFLNDDTQTLIYIEGELNKRDKRVTQCDGAESLQSLPFWYRPTVAMFKCFTGENDVERCDDFIQNQTIIDEVRKIVEDQYLCYTSESTDPQPSWDMYCFEHLTADPNNNSDYSVTKSIGNRSTNYTRSRDWSSDNYKKGEVQAIGIYWCADNEKYKLKTDKDQRVCACASYKTSKSRMRIVPQKPCNDGNFVKNMHLIETSPIFVKEDQPSKCIIPSITEDDDRRRCVNAPEKGSTQSCVIGMLKDQAPDIGCVREPNLSHGKEYHRMEHHEWHDYLICKEFFNPDEEPYRCVLRENDEKEYTKYGIICCCRPEACGAAYQEAAKFKPRKTFDVFVHRSS
uniref:Uncharacterized protein n=1 Tax=Panagrolaimus sp. ES5 TaxID=591445 RepID=A0AC34F1J6_9BILA